MAINESPVGTYTDVTGVIDATAAAEVAALIVLILGYIPNPADVTGTVPASPDFGNIPPSTAALLRAEIAAMAAAVAAAPTS